MDPVTDASINTLAQVIVRDFKPEKIILFGSRADGSATDGSDVDLLVVMDYEGRAFHKSLEIQKAIQPYRPCSVDLKVYSSEEVAWRYKGLDPLVCDALDEGRILYERQS